MSEVRLTLGWVVNAVDGRLLAGYADREVGDVVTDSRTLKAGDLFVALRGPRFDGHGFLNDAFDRGAVGAIVEPGSAGSARQDPANTGGTRHGGVIEVADTLKALQRLASAVRTAAGTKVIAITGSAGKTTTKESIAAFLAVRFRVAKNKGNLNNHIGLPLSLMQLRGGPDVAVMELGMNRAGEISALVNIADPEVRVWTNVGDAHLGFFASPDAIADAKAEILEYADSSSVLVCNGDDERIMKRVGNFPGRTITFGESAAAMIRATDVEDLGLEGMRARVTTPAGGSVIQTPLLGRGNLANVLAAAGAALDCGIPLDAIAAEARGLRPPDRRGVVSRIRDDVTLIDDSYNSSPSALIHALDVVARDRRATGKVAVLGEMLELGAHTIRLHEECGAAAAAVGLRLLFTVGGSAARAMADAAIAGGLPASAVYYVEKSEEAAPIVVAAIRAGDLVLVKGSRGTRTDVVADRIAAEFA